MKQKLISCLGALWMPPVERIEYYSETNCLAAEIFPKCNFFPQVLLKNLIELANNNGYHYYIDLIDGNIRMRIYENVES